MDTEVIILLKLGKEVAMYVKKHFTEELLKNKLFKANNYKQSLVETFLKMDEIMVTTEGKIELKNEAKNLKKKTKGRIEMTRTNNQKTIDRCLILKHKMIVT